MFRILTGAMLLFAVSLACACQSPTETEDLDDPVDVTAPGTTTARSANGRTFVLRRGDDPAFDETRTYHARAVFTVTSTLAGTAVDEDGWDMDLPLRVTSASVQVQQAAGGIVTPPTGNDVEHYEQGPGSVTGSALTEVGAAVEQTFEVWYWLPNGGKEALITVSYTFTDDDGATFSKSVDVMVVP